MSNAYKYKQTKVVVFRIVFKDILFKIFNTVF